MVEGRQKHKRTHTNTYRHITILIQTLFVGIFVWQIVLGGRGRRGVGGDIIISDVRARDANATRVADCRCNCMHSKQRDAFAFN